MPFPVSSPYDEGSAQLEDGDRAYLYTGRRVEAVDSDDDDPIVGLEFRKPGSD